MRGERALAISILAAVSGIVRAQCTPDWAALPVGAALTDYIDTFVVWDPDGPGPTPELLVAGGNFRRSGGTTLNFIATWDGAAWSPIGPGFDGTIQSLAVFDPDGPAPAPASLIAAGTFIHAGTTPISQIARWSGTQWEPLGSGLSTPNWIGDIWTMQVFDGGLAVGGVFTNAGGVPVLHLARWDGAAWHAFSDQRADAAYSFTLHNGSLVAAGFFQNPDPGPSESGVLRWTGQAWVNLGAHFPSDVVHALTVYRGQLIAGGSFANPFGNQPGQRIASFDGLSWGPLGSGTDNQVRAVRSFDPDGPGPLPDLLIAGGFFLHAGGQPASGVAAWDGSQWMPMGSGTNGPVYALSVYNHQLAIGGEFTVAGGASSQFFALWGCPAAPCYPDCDNSANLNVNDFVCFSQRFAARDPYANCDHSTEPQPLNVADFVCFMQQFAAGCP